jgi:hypothetical protein
MHSPILAPIVVLVGWTMVMWAWMYATRIPAIRAARMKLDPDAPRGAQMATLPARVRWKADNYNHLMEQPTVFYALALVLAAVGKDDGAPLVLAWIYVGLRIVHSIVQATWNKIEVRFSIFLVSSLVLIGMLIPALAAVL